MAIARAIRTVKHNFVFVVMPRHGCEREGGTLDRQLACDSYSDRAYVANDNLVSRKTPATAIHDADAATEHTLRMAKKEAIKKTDRQRLAVRIDPIRHTTDERPRH